MPSKRVLKKTKSILLCGVPGSGKTTLAQEWCKQEDWAYLSLNELVDSKNLYSQVDPVDGAKVVRLDELASVTDEWLDTIRSSAIVEGHLGCEINLPVDFALVLRLEPNSLAERLKQRGYNSYKVRQNKMAELLDYCTIRAIKNYGKKRVFEMDNTNLTLEQSMEQMRQILSKRSPPASFKPHIAWSEALYREVMLDSQ